MTEKPILESPTAEVKAHFQARDEANEQMARVAAAGWSSSQEPQHKAWHWLFANGTPEPITTPTPKVEAKPEIVSVKDVVTAFLADCEGKMESNTLRVRRYFLLPFADAYSDMPANALLPTLAEAYRLCRDSNLGPALHHAFAFFEILPLARSHLDRQAWGAYAAPGEAAGTNA
jgi:hypothetical protein